MSEDAKVFGGRWRVIERIGGGGQGAVYKAADTKGLPSPADLLNTLKNGLRTAHDQMIQMDPDAHSFDELMSAIREVVNVQHPPLAAVKELLPFEDAVNPKTALERMKAELEALTSVNHPALLKVLASDLDRGWFAMEYFASGPMSHEPGRFRGRVLGALKAFRPVVDAVSELHKSGIVHRDIKPENVFVAADGHLVLGDCGLAIKMERQERLTLTYENVGTRDYQPPWSYAMRLGDVKPNFDVFSLGKLLWAMVSGKPRFPLWYFDRDPHDLRATLPDNPDVLFVQNILKQCVVERSEHCILPDGAALLEEVDKSIRALSAGAVVPTKTGKMRCRFCGVGRYNLAENFAAFGNDAGGWPRHFYYCDNCGHLEVFVDPERRMPPAWKES